MASRLTAMEGNETYPRVSPDGKRIAFTSSQYTARCICDAHRRWRDSSIDLHGSL
ncbi:MAG: PD40 domain-containing protein [Saprospiraceae bacterium]|nr:PD40 domain-containing protein [Saprospiraceae bacterium]